MNQAVGKIGLALKKETALLSCKLHRNNSPSKLNENKIGCLATLFIEFIWILGLCVCSLKEFPQGGDAFLLGSIHLRFQNKY